MYRLSSHSPSFNTRPLAIHVFNYTRQTTRTAVTRSASMPIPKYIIPRQQTLGICFSIICLMNTCMKDVEILACLRLKQSVHMARRVSESQDTEQFRPCTHFRLISRVLPWLTWIPMVGPAFRTHAGGSTFAAPKKSSRLVWDPDGQDTEVVNMFGLRSMGVFRTLVAPGIHRG